MPSDIQVFVNWKDQTIFAGEDVECTITFRNAAESSNTAESNNNNHHQHQQRKQARPSTANSNSDSSFFSLKSPQNLFSSRRSSNSLSPQKKTSHRTSSSLSTPLVGSHSFPPPSTPRNGPSHGHKHKRSVSILSIDSEGGGGGGTGGGDKTPVPSSPFSRSRPPPPPPKGHGRSASLQVLPKRNESYDEGFPKVGRHSIRGLLSPESPMNPSPGNLRVDVDRPMRNHRTGSGGPSPIKPNESSRIPARRPQLPPIDFKFPAAPPSANESNSIRSAVSPSVASVDETAVSTYGKPTNKDGSSLPVQGHLPQMTRIISNSSLNGSRRSSGELYSASNLSSDTLQSEYTNYSTPAPRAIPPRHMRHHSSVDPRPVLANSQTLLMGYAQISASFTVDGSLINQSAFEDVKRKGVVGGQGSGTGAPSNRAPRGDRGRKGGGFWGALRWNNIEESLSGLLSNNDLDGLREMRGVSSSRSVPLLSTSQSLLFVDLRLAPGEEQSYSFAFTLPSGLPASHKGKAIKISYNLVIGTQRPSSSNEPQRVNRINVPFRVFSGVNGQGHILGHNLMSPYVLLRDEGRVQKVSSNPAPTWKQKSVSAPTWTSAPEFLSYVDEMLEQRSRGNLLQPPDTPAEKREIQTVSNTALSCKDAIDLAIIRSNQAAHHSSRSPNRFEIARNGRRIAVVVLNRPTHRLGETIITTVDFSDAALPCYALRVTLEASEKVAEELAVRSNASIHRATRRIHASFFENTLHATRVVFTPAVPISATPTILTSGVNHEWELRLEFVTPAMHSENGVQPSGAGLLEAVSQDERGQVLSALENLGCESFEIAIPLTVYGETVREKLPEENEGYYI